MGSEAALSEKSKKILEILGVPLSGEADTAALERALGILMRVKTGSETSKHAVVKDVRDIVEYVVLKSSNPESAVREASYMATPFDSPVLNEVFGYLVSKLAENLYKELMDKQALLKRQRINIAMDVIYNVATSRASGEIVGKVLGALKEKELGEGGE